MFETLWGRLMQGWVDGVRRLAWIVMAATILVTVGLGWYAAGHLGMNTDTTDMLAEDLPFRRANAAIEKVFPATGDLILVLVEADGADLAADSAQRLAGALKPGAGWVRSVSYPAADPFFRKNGLLFLSPDDLNGLVDAISRSQGMLAKLSADPSLRGLAEVLGLALDNLAEAGGAQGNLADALNRMAEVAEGQAAGRPATLAWREIMAGQTASPEDRRQLIIVDPKLDFASITPAGAAMDEIRRTAAELGLPEAGVRVRMTGGAAMAAEELASVEVGIGWIGAISSAVVALLLWGCFHSVRMAMYTFATMIVGLVWTFAFAAAAVGHLNLLSVAFAVLFVGLSVDFGIHFGVRYREQVAFGHGHAIALRNAAAKVGGAMALAALAAAIGFLSFLPTDYVGLSELGLIASAGMAAALIANLTVLPALITLWPADRPPRQSAERGLADRLRDGVLTYSRAIVLGALVLAGLAALLLPRAHFDFDPINLRDPNSESVAAFRDIAADHRATPYTVSILAPTLAAADALAARLTALPEVKEATTLSELLPTDQEDKLAVIGDLTQFLLPVLTAEPVAPPSPEQRSAATAQLVAKLNAVPSDSVVAAAARRLAAAMTANRALERLESALLGSLPARLKELKEALGAAPFTAAELPRDVRDMMLAADGEALIRVFPRHDVRDPEVLRQFVRAVQGMAPEAAGPAVTIVEAGAAVVRSFQQASLTALAAIVLMLLVVLRSPRDTVLVLTPLALAGVLVGAGSVLLESPFNFANVIVLPLLLGLGVSSGIYIVLRDREMRAAAASGAEVLRTATPRGVVFSALTCITSFGSLTFSAHPGTSSMGLLLTLALTLALLCTLVLLPALLHLVGHPPAIPPSARGSTEGAKRANQTQPATF